MPKIPSTQTNFGTLSRYKMSGTLIMLIALAFVSLMVGVAMAMQYGKTVARNRLAMEVAKASAESHQTLLKTYISKLHDGASAIINTFDKYILQEYFSGLLADTFKDRLSIIEQTCNIPEKGQLPSCNTVYGITTNEGPILIFGGSYNTAYKLAKRKLPFFTASNVDIQEYVKDNKVSLYGEVKIAMPSTMSTSHPDYQRLLELIDSARVEQVVEDHGEHEPSTVRFFNLVKTQSGYSLKQASRQIKPISKTLLSQSYNDVTLTYEGENIKVPMGDAIRVMTASLDNKENISIFGVTGSGKSCLADELARRMARNSRAAIIFIAPSMVPELQKVELLPQLTQDLHTLREEEGLTPIFFIDEAENLLEKTETGVHSVNNSFMLSMLDGQIQKMLGCCCVLTFNCAPSKLNAAAFREMRMGMQLQLHELEVSKAELLVETLKELNPTFVFDQAEWRNVKTNPLTLTLARVYNCFKSPTKQRILLDIIKELKGEITPPPSSKQKVQPSRAEVEAEYEEEVLPPKVNALQSDREKQPNSVSSANQLQGQRHGKKNKRNKGGGPR